MKRFLVYWLSIVVGMALMLALSLGLVLVGHFVGQRSNHWVGGATILLLSSAISAWAVTRPTPRWLIERMMKRD